MVLLIVLAIILIILSGWNLKSLYDLKKFNKSKQKLVDDRYYELKFKNEFITTVAIVVISVGAFFGYRASDEINKRADNLKTRFDSLDMSIKVKKDTINTYDSKAKDLDKKFADLSNKINVISNKNIVKQDFFIADNLKFAFGTDTVETHRFYFNRLKTLVGDPFPVFDKTPFLVVVPENGAVVTVIHLDKNYFEVYSELGVGDIDSAKFGIMVSKK